MSIASIMLRGEPTGQTKTWAGDVVATAKRDLKAGEKLDGEGGFMVYGKLMPAENSMKIEGLPIGLAHGLVLKNDVKQGQGTYTHGQTPFPRTVLFLPALVSRCRSTIALFVAETVRRLSYLLSPRRREVCGNGSDLWV